MLTFVVETDEIQHCIARYLPLICSPLCNLFEKSTSVCVAEVANVLFFNSSAEFILPSLALFKIFLLFVILIPTQSFFF